MKINNRRLFVCSDHHFGQKSFYRHNPKYGFTLRPEFASVEQADKAIIDNHNSIVPKHNSIVYFLGDLASNVTHLQKVAEMNGEIKVLIAGNHDTKFPLAALSRHFHQVLGCAYLLDRTFVLSHIPVHESELRGMTNIHGHTHRQIIFDKRYISACLEVNNYLPLEIEKINQ